jgi:hypothetical protein
MNFTKDDSCDSCARRDHFAAGLAGVRKRRPTCLGDSLCSEQTVIWSKL